MIVILGTGCLLIGSFFALVAAIGCLRLPDLFTRMHAITKAGTTGVGFTMVGVLCAFPEAPTATRVLAVIVFLALTAPISAHMIGRAAYFAGITLWEGTFIDQLREHHTAQPSTSDEPPSPDHRG